ncbi:MAG TPA: M1 family metallopeptidase [Vicinamibacterales bacterium]
MRAVDCCQAGLKTRLYEPLIACVLLFACTSPAMAADALSADRGFDVLHYAASIEPNIPAMTVAGHVSIHVRLLKSIDSLEFDRGELTIDAVREGSSTLRFEQLPRRVRVRLPRPIARGQMRTIDIDYRGTPRFGLQFAPERSQVYTIFSTSQWLVCIDAPDERATLDLRVALPADLRAAGSGRFMGSGRRGDGMVVHEWQEEHPVPSYTFGFAAGKFDEVTTRDRRIGYRYLGAAFASTRELERVFADTPDMVRFFGGRAGLPYPHATYTQVLVANTAGQELAGVALLSDAYGRNLRDNPNALNLSAHEVAHQWWGNLVTCRDWRHFWLNEGFATFMAAAYNEQRFGRAAYDRDIDAARMRYEQVRQTSGDRPLVFPSWDRPTADDRTIVYQKGAYVLHLLREMLGEQRFWKGIRDYTRRYQGQSVTTPDFQRAMEAATGRDLTDFFATWVYMTGSR